MIVAKTNSKNKTRRQHGLVSMLYVVAVAMIVVRKNRKRDYNLRN